VRLVLDASVIVKWALPDDAAEGHQGNALAVLGAVQRGEVDVLQPVHWLAEVAAVLARLRPQIAEQAIDLLDLMELPVAADVDVVKRAAGMAAELDHHLFDTLYHAVALEHGGTLVTADDRYLRKARRLGQIVSLGMWSL
jgi:predicted nucleic acid-binding protein